MRRLVLVPIVAGLIAACGTGGELPQLPLRATGATTGETAAGAAMPYRNVRYELADGLKANADHGDAYRFGNATLDDAHRVAKAFGVDGEPRRDEIGWTFGENTGAGIDQPTRTLSVMKTGMVSLNANGVASSGVACANPSGDGATVCGEPAPSPTTVPPATFSSDEAKRFALQRLQALGVDLPDPVVTVPAADGYFFSVHVAGRIDGEKVDGLEANVTLDQDKKITTLSAPLTTAKFVGSYELVSLQQAVDRLNSHSSDGTEPAIAQGQPGSEPTVVKLTAVRVGLLSTYGDNALWLTPSFVFTTDEGEGATVSVAAAADKYFPTTTTAPTTPSTDGTRPPESGSGGGSSGGGGSVEPAPPAPNAAPNCVSIDDPIPAQVCSDKVSYAPGETVHFTITASDRDRAFSSGPCYDGVTAEYGDDGGGDVRCLACSTSVADGPGKLNATRNHPYAKAGKYAAKFTIKSGSECGPADPHDSTAVLTLGIAVA